MKKFLLSLVAGLLCIPFQLSAWTIEELCKPDVIVAQTVYGDVSAQSKPQQSFYGKFERVDGSADKVKLTNFIGLGEATFTLSGNQLSLDGTTTWKSTDQMTLIKNALFTYTTSKLYYATSTSGTKTELSSYASDTYYTYSQNTSNYVGTLNPTTNSFEFEYLRIQDKSSGTVATKTHYDKIVFRIYTTNAAQQDFYSDNTSNEYNVKVLFEEDSENPNTNFKIFNFGELGWVSYLNESGVESSPGYVSGHIDYENGTVTLDYQRVRNITNSSPNGVTYNLLYTKSGSSYSRYQSSLTLPYTIVKSKMGYRHLPTYLSSTTETQPVVGTIVQNDLAQNGSGWVKSQGGNCNLSSGTVVSFNNPWAIFQAHYDSTLKKDVYSPEKTVSRSVINLGGDVTPDFNVRVESATKAAAFNVSGQLNDITNSSNIASLQIYAIPGTISTVAGREDIDADNGLQGAVLLEGSQPTVSNPTFSLSCADASLNRGISEQRNVTLFVKVTYNEGTGLQPTFHALTPTAVTFTSAKPEAPVCAAYSASGDVLTGANQFDNVATIEFTAAEGCAIRYTAAANSAVNNVAATYNSPLYTEPIECSETTTFSVVADNNGVLSDPVTFTVIRNVETFYMVAVDGFEPVRYNDGDVINYLINASVQIVSTDADNTTGIYYLSTNEDIDYDNWNVGEPTAEDVYAVGTTMELNSNAVVRSFANFQIPDQEGTDSYVGTTTGILLKKGTAWTVEALCASDIIVGQTVYGDACTESKPQESFYGRFEPVEGEPNKVKLTNFIGLGEAYFTLRGNQLVFDRSSELKLQDKDIILNNALFDSYAPMLYYSVNHYDEPKIPLSSQEEDVFYTYSGYTSAADASLKEIKGTQNPLTNSYEFGYLRVQERVSGSYTIRTHYDKIIFRLYSSNAAQQDFYSDNSDKVYDVKVLFEEDAENPNTNFKIFNFGELGWVSYLDESDEECSPGYVSGHIDYGSGNVTLDYQRVHNISESNPNAVQYEFLFYDDPNETKKQRYYPKSSVPSAYVSQYYTIVKSKIENSNYPVYLSSSTNEQPIVGKFINGFSQVGYWATNAGGDCSITSGRQIVFNNPWKIFCTNNTTKKSVNNSVINLGAIDVTPDFNVNVRTAGKTNVFSLSGELTDLVNTSNIASMQVYAIPGTITTVSGRVDVDANFGLQGAVLLEGTQPTVANPTFICSSADAAFNNSLLEDSNVTIFVKVTYNEGTNLQPTFHALTSVEVVEAAQYTVTGEDVDGFNFSSSATLNIFQGQAGDVIHYIENGDSEEASNGSVNEVSIDVQETTTFEFWLSRKGIEGPHTTITLTKGESGVPFVPATATDLVDQIRNEVNYGRKCKTFIIAGVNMADQVVALSHSVADDDANGSKLSHSISTVRVNYNSEGKILVNFDKVRDFYLGKEGDSNYLWCGFGEPMRHYVLCTDLRTNSLFLMDKKLAKSNANYDYHLTIDLGESASKAPSVNRAAGNVSDFPKASIMFNNDNSLNLWSADPDHYFAAGSDSNAAPIALFVSEGNQTTGIEDVAADESEDAEVEYYDLLGNRVVNPQAGRIYIRRQGCESSKVVF